MSSSETPPVTNRVILKRMELAKAQGKTWPKPVVKLPQQIPRKLLRNVGPRQVVQHDDKVTKFLPEGTGQTEAVTMRFVREHTSIPVPYVHESTDTTITMEFIEGVTLEKAWNTLSDEERSNISIQLRDDIEQMRNMDTSGVRIGAVDGGPAIDRHMINSCQGGPFTCEAEYNDFLLDGLHSHCPDAVRRICQSQLRTDHKITFTHGDLHGTNILVRDGCIVALLDWELAGFYPEYVEYIGALAGASWTVGYYNALLDIFPCRYDAEYLTYRTLNGFHKYS
ncbi:hypothetical protein E8E14_014714 [Neopestalotiopsis sp. 37M]|nr:hypothetical protein E8E14_014714 [Neopestalotiopsis sp. 37M]